MRLIDVLVRQCNGGIRKGTKLIVDLSSEQDSPETYIYDGERFIDESYYEWFECYGASKGVLNKEVKLIEPQLYYCKMPNSERMIGLLGYDKKLIFESLATFRSRYTNVTYMFTQDEIDNLDILAPYRDFEWSEYRESVDS